MTWAQDRRMDFIRDRIAAGLTLNRADLMRRFGISQPQASTDIQRFIKANPGARTYDASAKAYDGSQP